MKIPFFIQVLFLGLLGCIILVLGLSVGPFDLSFRDIFNILSGNTLSEMGQTVLVDLRLPRLLLGFVSGAILTLGGFYMQALLRNPLADPYIMGISSGAGLGVNLVILGIIPFGAWMAWSYPLFAFLGGCGSLALVMVLGYSALRNDTTRLLIAGIAVSSLFMALTGLIIYKFAESDQIRQILFWSFGSLDKGGWDAVIKSSIFLGIGWIAGLFLSHRLDVLILGEEQAGSLGMNVPQMRLFLLILTVLIVGGSIAFTGPISFVGMMVPHFSRGLNKTGHRKNLVFGTLLGGIYLMLCDILGQLIHPPAGLPIGIITAILGVPFFLYLLFGSREKI